MTINAHEALSMFWLAVGICLGIIMVVGGYKEYHHFLRLQHHLQSKQPPITLDIRIFNRLKWYHRVLLSSILFPLLLATMYVYDHITTIPRPDTMTSEEVVTTFLFINMACIVIFFLTGRAIRDADRKIITAIQQTL